MGTVFPFPAFPYASMGTSLSVSFAMADAGGAEAESAARMASTLETFSEMCWDLSVLFF
jgi:hypothetical protein